MDIGLAVGFMVVAFVLGAVGGGLSVWRYRDKEQGKMS